MKRVLKYLGYISIVIGLSFLGIVWILYVSILSASVGVLSTNHALYGYIETTNRIINLSLTEIYSRTTFSIIMLGILGYFLTRIGGEVVPEILRKYQ